MADKWIQLMSEDGTDNLYPTSKMDLLWENASPSSSFAAQTVSIDLTKYSKVVMQAIEGTGYSNINNYLALTDGSTIIMQNSFGKNRYRYVTVSSSGIGFDDGKIYNSYASSATTDNSVIVPSKIYGIK